ncbi:MAG: amidohydrolase family protein [Pseudomonadota bacterium]|nr:amidohydrolase family protein [Pseudomonadota bacterium]
MRICILAAAAAVASGGASAQGPGKPVIDMHLHAFPVEFAAGAPGCPGDQEVLVLPLDPQEEFDYSILGTCADPFFASESDEALLRETIEALERYNVRHAVTSGALKEVSAWRAAAPERIIPALNFAGETRRKAKEFQRLYEEDAFQVFAEITAQYRGVPADDPVWEPYYALAEELDIPIGIHFGQGPPAAARFPGYETYRVALTSPFQLEKVLQKHPKLRVYAMHYASPLVDEMIAMLFTYPNLYVDISCNNWAFPRAQFYDELKRMIDAGMEKRILFGSDQMVWPQAIGEAIRAVEEAPFLSESQKRDIFYNNAARFLRLSEEEIARDHAE